MKILKKVACAGALTLTAICCMAITSKAATVKVTGETLNIRKGPSTSTEVVAQLYEGVKCELISEEGDWYKVKYKNYTGYVSKQYVELIQDSSESTENNTNENNINTDTNDDEINTNTENNEQKQDNNSNQNSQEELKYKKLKQEAEIKILPLIYSSKIGVAKQNEKVIFIAQTAGWSYIQTDTINGWVRSDNLETTTAPEPNESVDNSDSSESNEKVQIAYINEETVNLRKGAGTKFDIVKVLKLNAELTILETQGDWYKVKAGNDTGYVLKEFVSSSKKTTSRSSSPREKENAKTITTDEEKTDNENSSDTTKVENITKDNVSEVLQNVVNNINKNNENSSKSTDSKSNKSSKSSKSNSDSKETSSNKSNTEKSNSSSSIKGTDIIAYAQNYLGHKYVYGGDGSNGTFDCSGFTMYVFKHFGINLPHGATSQYKSGKGTKISKQSDLKVGDIVLLTDHKTGKGIGHCGIYMGNGNFIHASTTTYTVTISNLNTTYKGRFYAGLRLI